MQRNRKGFFVLLLMLLAIVTFLTFRFVLQDRQKNIDNPSAMIESSNEENQFILSNYPLSTVPLYEFEKIDSMKFFVNNDKEELVNYYNVVFETKVSKEQLFEYYRSLMSSQNSDESSSDRVVGMIDIFKVTVSRYEDATVYLEVFLPQEKLTTTNPYYADYPQDLVTIQNSWELAESSFGKLNQNGGQIEYTQYFNIPKEKDESGQNDPWEYYYQMYKKLYVNKTNLVTIDDKKMLQWESSDYKITLTFSSSHQRVYLMIRSKMSTAKQ